MNIEIERLNSSERRIKFSLPADELNQEIDKRIRSLSKTTSVPGFRKGKIPKRVIEKRHGEAVRNEALRGLIDDPLTSALKDYEINAVAQPYIEGHRIIDETNNCEISVIVEVMPDIDVTSIAGCKTVRPVVDVTEDDIDEALKLSKEKWQMWDSVDRAAQENDRLVAKMDVVYKSTGESQSLGTSYIHLGSKNLAPEVREACVGALKGQRVVAVVQHKSENSDNADEANQQISETIQYLEIQEVQEAVEGKYSDQFYEEIGVESEQDENFREKAASKFKSQIELEIRNVRDAQVLLLLMRRNKTRIPQALVLGQIRNQLRASYRLNDEQAEQYIKSDLTSMQYHQAQMRVFAQILLSKIKQEQNLQVNEDEILEDMNQIKENLSETEKTNEKSVQLMQMMENLKRESKEQELADTIVKQIFDESDYEEVAMSVEDFRKWALEFDVLAHQGGTEESPQPEAETAGEPSSIVDAHGNPFEKTS